MHKYFKNEQRFEAFVSKDDLLSIPKNGVYVMNLDDYIQTGTYWVAFCLSNDSSIYSVSFEEGNVPDKFCR